jgi:hypothetical protein
VHTSYGQRARAAVEQDIQTYRKFYKIDGFFIDEMANTPQAVGYYEKVYRFIKQLGSDLKVVGNPGTPFTLPAYLNAVDTMVIFEGSAAAYAAYQPLQPAPWVADYPPSRFANIVYDLADRTGVEKALSKARQTHAGSVFLTDQKMPNPYRGLPPYWAHEIAAIQAQDRQSPPIPAAAASMTGSPALPAAIVPAPSSQWAATVLLPMPEPESSYILTPGWQLSCEARPLRRFFRLGRLARRRAIAPGCAELADQ